MISRVGIKKLPFKHRSWTNEALFCDTYCTCLENNLSKATTGWGQQSQVAKHPPHDLSHIPNYRAPRSDMTRVIEAWWCFLREKQGEKRRVLKNHHPFPHKKVFAPFEKKNHQRASLFFDKVMRATLLTSRLKRFFPRKEGMPSCGLNSNFRVSSLWGFRGRRRRRCRKLHCGGVGGKGGRGRNKNRGMIYAKAGVAGKYISFPKWFSSAGCNAKCFSYRKSFIPHSRGERGRGRKPIKWGLASSSSYYFSAKGKKRYFIKWWV